MEPEVKLARAKILVMLEEIGGHFAYEKSMNRAARIDKALWWFTSRTSDFEAWCDDAELNIDMVREKALEIYEKGFPQVKAANGKGARYKEGRRYRLKLAERASV